MSPGFPRSLFEVLGQVIDADIMFDETRSGPGIDEDPFADSTADLGWICSTSYVDLAMRGPDPTIQLAGVAWVPDDPDSEGRPVYFGDIAVQADSGIRSFEDLAGRRIGCNDPISLSGHHALRFAMRDRGLDEATFAELVFSGGHHHSLDQLIEGELDAVVVDSVVRTARARHDLAVADMRIIERLGPWPVQPLVVRSTLSQADVEHVRRAILHAGDRADVKAELEAAALSHFVEVGPDHYAEVATAMRQ